MQSTIPRIISVDDHVVEPPHLWQTRLPAKFRSEGPRVEILPRGEPRLVDGVWVEEPGDSDEMGARRIPPTPAPFDLLQEEHLQLLLQGHRRHRPRRPDRPGSGDVRDRLPSLGRHLSEHKGSCRGALRTSAPTTGKPDREEECDSVARPGSLVRAHPSSAGVRYGTES